MKQRAFNILKYLLVTLFVSYYCQSTLFVHTHDFEWGQVTHSHPYMPSGSHSHSWAQCQTLDALTNILFTIVAATVIATVLRSITICHAPHLRGTARHLIEHSSDRAPPIFS